MPAQSRIVAVTGAAGFIGWHLAQRLRATGHRLILVDNPSKIELTKQLFPGFSLEFVGIEDFPKALDRNRWDLVGLFHLGACSSTTETNWDYLRQNNIEYSKRLWNWCAKSGCPFHYASSAATYGNGSLGFDDETNPRLLKPLNLYGKSKNDFDTWVLELAEQGEPTPPRWAGFKFFNVYGPGEIRKGPLASVVWQSFKQIKETGIVKLFRSNNANIEVGQQERDFVFVEDCVDHMIWHWNSNAPSGIYNSGSGMARTFADLAKAVFKALNLPPKIEFIEMPPTLSAQYQNHTRARMGKIQKT